MDYFKSSVGGAEMADVANDNWINIDEAAEYLGVKPGTIRDYFDAFFNRFPAICCCFISFIVIAHPRNDTPANRYGTRLFVM